MKIPPALLMKGGGLAAAGKMVAASQLPVAAIATPSGAFNELGRGRLAAGMAKTLNVTDVGALRSLAPEISSVVQLPISEEELMILSGFGRWMCGFAREAVAGQAMRTRIRNPATSGVLVIVERITVSAVNTALWRSDGGYAFASDLSNIALQEFRDSRLRPRSGGAAVVSQEVSGAILTGTGPWWYVLGNTASLMPGLPILLAPGAVLDVGSDTVNNPAAITFEWRERGGSAAELANV